MVTNVSEEIPQEGVERCSNFPRQTPREVAVVGSWEYVARLSNLGSRVRKFIELKKFCIANKIESWRNY